MKFPLPSLTAALVLLGLGAQGRAEEISHYRFEAGALGDDSLGRNPLAADQLLAAPGEGGAQEGSNSHADFSQVDPEPAPRAHTLEGLSLTQSHSAMLWVRPGYLPAETGTVRYYFSLGPSVVRLGLMRVDSGSAFFSFSVRKANGEEYANQLRAAPFDPRSDRWHLIAYSYDADTQRFRFFVNGKQVAEEEGALFDAGPSFILGWASGSAGFQGALDEVRLFNHALEPHELDTPAEP